MPKNKELKRRFKENKNFERRIKDLIMSGQLSFVSFVTGFLTSLKHIVKRNDITMT